MTKAIATGPVTARKFTLPLMAASAAIALMSLSAPAMAKPAEQPKLSKPLMARESGAPGTAKRGDQPEMRQTAQRGDQPEMRQTAQRGDRRGNERNARGFDRNGKAGFLPARGWKVPKSWLAVRGEIISVGQGRHANTFTVIRQGKFNGRPALITVQYRDPRHGAPKMVPGSKRLVHYTYQNKYGQAKYGKVRHDW